MGKNNMFIFVTRSGSVYDRTDGKNERIFFGKEYPITNGILKFMRLEDRKVLVTRTSSLGNTVYSKELTESGMYIVTPLFVQPLLRTTKDVRLLYNRIKRLLSKPKFKIVDRRDFEEPVKIQFIVKNEGGVLETRFVVKVNPDLLTAENIEETCDLIERTSVLDLQILLKNFNLSNNREIILTINNDFIETSLLIEKHYKSKGEK